MLSKRIRIVTYKEQQLTPEDHNDNIPTEKKAHWVKKII